MIDINQLETKLDNTLAKESRLSLTWWLFKKRLKAIIK